MEKTDAIKLWKELKIDRCEMLFSCGGDSMNDWSFEFYNDKDEEIESEDLKNYFDDAVFNNVDFYVNSDGHYVGEAGTVSITLDEDEEEEDFCYEKSAESEFEEQHSEVTDISLSSQMIKFIKENVSNINGGDGNVTINFKRDFILTDVKEKLLKEIEETITNEACEFVPEQELEGEITDWRTFTTNDDDILDNLTIKGNSLKMAVTVTYTKYEPSE